MKKNGNFGYRYIPTTMKIGIGGRELRGNFGRGIHEDASSVLYSVHKLEIEARWI